VFIIELIQNKFCLQRKEFLRNGFVVVNFYSPVEYLRFIFEIYI